MTKFVQEYTIKLSDIEPDCYLKRIAIAEYFQESFARYCAENNVAANDVIKQNLIWVIADSNIEFSDEMPFWREKIKTEIWVSEVKKLRIYIDFKVYYKDKIIAKGDSCWFLLDATSKRPQAPASIVSCFGTNDELVFGSHKSISTQFKGNKIAQSEHKVNITDLDFNAHVSNLSYLSIAYSSIPLKYLHGYKIKSFSVKYLKECFLNDILISESYKEKNKFYSKITRQQDDTEVCFIESEVKQDLNAISEIPEIKGVRVFANT